MKKCLKCNAMMPDNAAFCTSCGTKFETQSFDQTTVLDPSQNPYAKRNQQAANSQQNVSKSKQSNNSSQNQQQNVNVAQQAQNFYAGAYSNVNKAQQVQQPINSNVNSQKSAGFAVADAGNSYNQNNKANVQQNTQGNANNTNYVAKVANGNSPMLKLPTGRGLIKFILLSIVTLGIYNTVVWSRMSTEINISASRYDGKRTMPYLGMLMLSVVTLMIYPLYWFHQFSKRVGNELTRRGIDFKFGAFDFWIFNVLLSLVIVGPFIYAYKLLKAMNLINENYNIKG